MWDIIIIVGLVLSSIVSLSFYFSEPKYNRTFDDIWGGFACGIFLSAILIGLFFLFKCILIPQIGFRLFYALIPILIIGIGCNLDKLKFRIKVEKK